MPLLCSWRPWSSARVRERRLVAADAAVLEGEAFVVDPQLVGDELVAGAVVPGDDTADGGVSGIAVADPHRDVVSDAQPLPPARVVELDSDLADAEEPALLPRPREVGERVAAESAGEDRLERRGLLVAGSFVEIEDPAPR